MDLDQERFFQQQRQRKAIESSKGKGVTRIGARISETDRYEVLMPDGSKNPNGVKIFSAEHTIGDIVLAYPRADGTIALDSYKGSRPSSVPETPKPQEQPKPPVWILYEHDRKLWVGGHQPTPVEIGSIGELGPSWFTLSNIQKLSNAHRLKCHIWGSGSRWVAMYRSAVDSSISLRGRSTLTRVENGSKKTIAIEFDTSQSPYVFNDYDLVYKTAPIGGGLFHFVQKIGDSVELKSRSPNTHGGTLTHRFFLWDGESTIFNDLAIGYADQELPPPPFHDFTVSRQASGTVPIPAFSGSRRLGGQYYANNNTHGIQTAAFTSSIDFPILFDGTNCYWIKEEIQNSGGGESYPVYVDNLIYPSPADSVIRAYTLYYGETKIIKQSNPKFFGVYWRLRPTGVPFTSEDRSEFHDAVSPERSAWYFGREGFGNDGLTSVGEYPQAIAGITENPLYPPIINPFTNETLYPNPIDGMPVSLVNGMVVGVPSDEIIRATQGGGNMRRVARNPDNSESELSPAYCYPIPPDALSYHWCCDNA